MKKAIIFIDANNWYHNVKKFFNPGSIDINKITNLICSFHKFELVEIKWYASTPSLQDGEAMYYSHMSFLSSLEKQGIKIITRKLQRNSNKEILEEKKEIIKSLELCETCHSLVNENCVNCLGNIKRKEKGIDVWIAVDMIKESVIDKRCDVCVLISGDADFVPALELIEKAGKEVLSASVPEGYSFELRKKFKYFFLGRNKLQECLKDYKDFKKD